MALAKTFAAENVTKGAARRLFMVKNEKKGHARLLRIKSGAACVLPASWPPRDSGPCGSWGWRGVKISLLRGKRHNNGVVQRPFSGQK